jgi:hypothetical protein
MPADLKTKIARRRGVMVMVASAHGAGRLI